MTEPRIILGPGRLYIAPLPKPPTRWTRLVEAWHRWRFRRALESGRWVPIGYTDTGVEFTYAGEILP